MDSSVVLSLLVLAALALVIGAVVLLRKGGSRKQAMLMLVLAAVAILNVAIWTLPDASGVAPASKSLEMQEPSAQR